MIELWVLSIAIVAAGALIWAGLIEVASEIKHASYGFRVKVTRDD